MPDPDLDAPAPSYDISWGNRNCTAGQRWGVQPSNCPHANQWFYTVNDAFLGRICQVCRTANRQQTRLHVS